MTTAEHPIAEAHHPACGITMLWTTRHGGTSTGEYASLNLGDHVGDIPAAVARNRELVREALGSQIHDVVYMAQQHTNRVTTVTTAADATGALDAVVTTTPGLGLAVMTADCVPLLLFDAQHRVVAACHAGRVGAVSGIVDNTIDEMLARGAKEHTLHVHLGPAASGCRYELPEDMVADVEAALPGSRTATTQGTAGVDLRAGIVGQLRARNIPADNISCSEICTIADDNYFSYRRDGRTGRMAGIIALTPT